MKFSTRKRKKHQNVDVCKVSAGGTGGTVDDGFLAEDVRRHPNGSLHWALNVLAPGSGRDEVENRGQ